MLLLIGWFVWSGAGREAAMVRRSRSVGWPVTSSPAGVVHEAEVVRNPPTDQRAADERPRGRHYRIGPVQVYRDEEVTDRTCPDAVAEARDRPVPRQYSS